MKAVLKYYDCHSNHQYVHSILALYNIKIVKFKQSDWNYYSRVTIQIENYKALTDLVCKLNKGCGVILAKTMPDSIWDWLKK